MKAQLIRTDKIYHDIINAPDDATRQHIYLEKIAQPWAQMMSMMAGMFAGDNNASIDPDQALIDGAKRFNWLLPEHLSQMPDALVKLEEAQAWQVATEALEKGVAQFEPYADRLPFDTIEGWLMLADPTTAEPYLRGYTGATDWMNPRFIAQFDTPNDYNIPRLPGLIVHEMHHLIRFALYPFGPQTSVADYIVAEGTAESFAAALFGEDIVGYYVTDIDEDGLNTAKTIIGDNLNTTGFDVIRSYIFGDTIATQYELPRFGMPEYGGYATGYRVVHAYMQRTGKSIVETTFIPATEICAESGYFD